MTFAGNLLVRSSLWTPANISTALWLDAADASTVTTVSGAVSQWDDKSGNGRNAVQGTAANRPAYNATGLNGLPTVSFDGTNDSLLGTYNGSLAFNSHSFFAVVDLVITPDNFCIVFFPAADTGGFGLRESSKFYDAFNSFSVGPSSQASNGIVLISSIKDSVSAHDFYNFGELKFSDTLSYTASSPTSYRMGWNSIGSYYKPKISELIILNSNATTDTRQRIEGYLAHKWGLTANLPSGHPYKSVAP